MSDLIDRQTALETAIEAADKWDGGYSSEREGIIRKFFDKVPAVQPDHTADIGKKAEKEDCISKKMAIDAIMGQPPEPHYPSWYAAQIEKLPAAQPDRDVIDDCLRHIYKNISVHTATGGVITIKHYMQVLYEEIYGEGERPWWMT